MNHSSLDGYRCLVCLDFGALPGIGPCPACRGAAYVEFVIAVLKQFDTAGPAPAGSADHSTAGGEAA